ncbi:hypothetical protein VTN31DRAFT_5381 [Thermomyces dupontii]|uniref:uncharacterized protein n=1 Tax=Talaromyces thermophilus TaxID=28565 RepID=UPI003743351F
MSFLARWWGSPAPKETKETNPTPPTESHPSQPSPSQQTPPTSSSTETSLPSNKPRINNNLKLLLGGAVFFGLSIIVTRRSLARRRMAAMPPYYTSAPLHQPRVNGPLEAFEALNIATINVLSLAMMGVGGTLYALDINSMDDLRRFVRSGMGIEGRTEQDAEEELEEWVASVLDRRERKNREKRSDSEGDKGR